MKTKLLMIFAVGIIGFVWTAYASEPEPEPVGVDTLEYGIFDSNDNKTHLLKVGQKYEIRIHFKSELDESVPFRYAVQVLDKDRHWSDPVDEFVSTGTLKPSEEKQFSFEWTPEYEGKFRTFVVIGNPVTSTAIGGATQYDFEVSPSNQQMIPSDKIPPQMENVPESLHAAFDANVDIEGFPIKDIVIGHRIDDGKYIVDVNADFLDSRYWPDIQENITSIIGADLKVEYHRGESLNICREGTVFKDGVCMVTNPAMTPPDGETCGYGVESVNAICIVNDDLVKDKIPIHIALYSYFTIFVGFTSLALFTSSILYFVFGKRHRKLIAIALAITGIAYSLYGFFI